MPMLLSGHFGLVASLQLKHAQNVEPLHPCRPLSLQALLRVLGQWPSMLQWPAQHIGSKHFQNASPRLPEVQLQHLEVAKLLLDARADPEHPARRGDHGQARFSRIASSGASGGQ